MPAVGAAEDAELSRLGAALKQLLLASFGMRPDDLPAHVRDAAEVLGASETVVLVADLDQDVLRPLDPEPGVEEHDVDGEGPGLAYREERVVVEAVPGGRRLWVPLKDSAERIGILAVVDDGSVDASSWEALGSLAGELVVSKASYGDALVLRRRRREVSLAAEMRWALLPTLTYTSDDVAISGIVRPSYGIAGDAFDYGVAGRRLSITVLDAMGHGLEASRMANVAVSSYRNSRRHGLSPSAMLMAIDAVIASEFGEAKFVTGQTAELDLDTGRLVLANAGHPPPFVLRADGDVETVDCDPGRPAGLGIGTPSEITVELAPRDTILFRTDGVSDARSPKGRPFGDERVAEAVRRHLASDMPPAEVLRRTMAEVVEHQGGRAGDDATLVLARWRP